MMKLRVRQKQLPQILVSIIVLSVWGLLCLYKPSFFYLNNFLDKQLLDRGKSKYYQDMLNKWLHYNNNLNPQNIILANDSIIADVVKTLFVEDQMFPGGKYNFEDGMFPGEHFNESTINLNGQIGAPNIVDKLLGKKRNGFFIEAGAVDGLHFSNTLFFEMKRNYTGLLIEPSSHYKQLRLRNRKVRSLNVCLSRKPIPEEVTFLDCFDIGGIEGEVRGWTKETVNSANTTRTKVLCLPVHLILSALGNPKVDYFSLDVEGVELDVLKSIPWDRVHIDVFSIEVYGNDRDPDEVSQYMRKSGYTKVVSALKDTDDIYVRNDFRSPIFGHDQRPRLITKRRFYDLPGMKNKLFNKLFNANSKLVQ